ncbi:hypothetical protein Rmet_6574 [Cupriavidus metallidurans CH34]|uniref:Uncharacterized protein n=1 Tax=Cupriavidus metallidurans (strain ATCC 43123 / DSM 2839 / NBRC 102507 / CH34) TaxID=266264 RepID=D3DY06_CUPMC|nr:hypothetical protein Rmet_6574 [Cupriavidus metallidurans CH34]
MHADAGHRARMVRRWRKSERVRMRCHSRERDAAALRGTLSHKYPQCMERHRWRTGKPMLMRLSGLRA